jgi:hypothetical protein
MREPCMHMYNSVRRVDCMIATAMGEIHRYECSTEIYSKTQSDCKTGVSLNDVFGKSEFTS